MQSLRLEGQTYTADLRLSWGVHLRHVDVCMITWSIYHIHIACSKESLDNQQGAMLQASPTALLAAWSASSCLGCTAMPSRSRECSNKNLDVSAIVTTIVGGFSPTHLKKYARQIGSFPQGSGWNKKLVETPPKQQWRHQMLQKIILTLAAKTYCKPWSWWQSYTICGTGAFNQSISSWWFFTNPFEAYAQIKLDHFLR